MAPEDPQQPAPKRSPKWGLGLRMVVSAVLLAVLVSRIDFEGAFPKHGHLSTIIFFALAVLTATIGIVLSAWRWQRVLAAFGTPVPLRALVMNANHLLALAFTTTLVMGSFLVVPFLADSMVATGAPAESISWTPVSAWPAIQENRAPAAVIRPALGGTALEASARR